MLHLALYSLLTSVFCLTATAAPSGAGFWNGKRIRYQVVDGRAVVEGDIVLGTVEELETPGSTGKSASKSATIDNDTSHRWPGGVVYYTIDSTLKNQQRVTDAIAHWEANTPIRFQQRTTQSNYVRFVTGSGCSSEVGMTGGRQDVELASGCETGAAIHEIGHVVGLWHEQSRQDRNFYVRLVKENIDKEMLPQFDQAISDGKDQGPYDYSSIMHYSGEGFSKNYGLTMQSVPQGIPLGQRIALSPGDIDAVKRMYGQTPTETVISTNPFGLQVVVDGVAQTAPVKVQWAPGSRHTLAMVDRQAGSDSGTRLVPGRWSNDGSFTQTVVADPETTFYVANYVRQFRLTSNAAGGQVTADPPSSDGFYPEGTKVTLTAAGSGKFLGWTGSGYGTLHGKSANPVSFEITDSGLQYTATFTNGPLTQIGTDFPGVRASIDGRAVTLPQNYTWTPGTTHTLAITDLQQPFGSGAIRFACDGWSTGDGTTQTVTASESGASIKINCRRQFKVTTAAYPSSGGSIEVTPSSGDGFYDEGTTLQFRINGSRGYQLLGWTGDLGDADGANATLAAKDQEDVLAVLALPGQLSANFVMNAASYVGGQVAPGEIVTLFGVQVGNDPLTKLKLNAQGRADSSLANTRVLFDGVAAPLVYVSANQLSAVVPYSVAGKTSTRVQVERNGSAGNAVSMPVTASVPGLFTANSSGDGPGAVLNQDGSVNDAIHPAVRGSTIVLYATGEGAVDQAGIDGRPAAVPLAKPRQTVRARIGGRYADVSYAGGAPGLVAGVMQVNVRVPDDCPTGQVPVQILVGDQPSPQTVTVAVQ